MGKPDIDIKLDDLVLRSDEHILDDKEPVEEEEKVVVEEALQVRRNKLLDYASRGFKTLEDAYMFTQTDTFDRLGEADKQEYIAWLNK